MRLRTSRLLRVLGRGGRPRRLVDCERCGRDLVNPVAWLEYDEDRWWIRVRCGGCGSVREVVVDNEEARRYDLELDRGVKEIERSLDRLTHDAAT